MPRLPQISDAEWAVMNVLWEQAPRTATEVAGELCDRMHWHPKTVKTLLGRLVKKGAVRYRQEANRYLYSPAFTRRRLVTEAARSFVDRVFGGRTAPALVHMVESAELSEDDRNELRALLDRKQKEDKK